MVTIEVSPKLKDDRAHTAIAATHIGQAHIAGTGSKWATCGQCGFWHKWKRAKIEGESRLIAVEPGNFSASHKSRPGASKDALCNKPKINKARRTIPATATARRFFTPKDIQGES